ncbi:MAG: undecaprenyl-phosphate galactose phosphotransferase WbaP [Rubrobacteraceae bacterium]
MERVTEKTITSYRDETFPVERPDLLSPVWKKRMAVATLVGSDVLLALVIWMMAYVFRDIWWRPGGVTGVTILAIAPSVAVWIGLRGLLGLYPGYGLDAVERLRRHAYSVFATLAILAVLALGFQVGNMLSRLLIGLAFLGLLFVAPIVRHFLARSLHGAGAWGRPVIVLSYKDTGTEFMNLLRREWRLGYNPVALFDYNLLPAGESYVETSYQETLADAVKFACGRGVDTAILAMPYTRRERLAQMVGVAGESFRHVLIVPNLSGVTNSAVIARNFAGTFAVEIKHNLLNPWARRAKRVVDCVSTVIGGALILPLLLVLAVLVYAESRGPIFYRDKRMGRDGSLFSCVKFRTMVPGAEEKLRAMLEEDDNLRGEYMRFHKLRDDPRVTRVGHFLRKTSLDELPQLWNVLRGEMSLVGPRPYLPRESEEIGVTQREILRVPPGITGPWQVSGRNRTSFSERVDMDAYYVRDWSIWLDVVLLTRTLHIVWRGGGAY